MIKKLINFKNNGNQIEVLKRSAPSDPNSFFQELSKSISAITGFVHKSKSK